jgi:hypothetical protein
VRPAAEILASLIDGRAPESSLPELLCQDACRRLPVSAAGIALMNRDGVMELAVGSDERAARLEDLQLTIGEGPCVDSFGSGRLVLHPDLRAPGSDRWPVYSPAALELGVQAIFSFPLRIGGIRLGVLDLYRDQAGLLDDADLALALHYADAAVMLVLYLHTEDYESAAAGRSDLSPGRLELEFHAHPEVHQATGMVSVQAGVDLTEALLLLRARAYADGRSVAAIARDVVRRVIVFN